MRHRILGLGVAIGMALGGAVVGAQPASAAVPQSGVRTAIADITWNYASPVCSKNYTHFRWSPILLAKARRIPNRDKKKVGTRWVWTYKTMLYSYASGGNRGETTFTTKCSR